MPLSPLGSYPGLRMRRLRQADWIRRLVRESSVTPSDLIWSMVIHDGEGRVPVGSLPGVERLSVDEAAKAAVRARDLAAWTIGLAVTWLALWLYGFIGLIVGSIRGLLRLARGQAI